MELKQEYFNKFDLTYDECVLDSKQGAKIIILSRLNPEPVH